MNSQVEAPVEDVEKSQKTTKKDSIEAKTVENESKSDTKSDLKSTDRTVEKAKKSEQRAAKKAEKAQKIEKSHGGRKSISEVKLFARPFVALGRYIRDSWRELRLVRWPDRKTTWKMTFAVLIYCALMMVFILLLDTLFTFLFNLAFN